MADVNLGEMRRVALTNKVWRRELARDPKYVRRNFLPAVVAGKVRFFDLAGGRMFYTWGHVAPHEYRRVSEGNPPNFFSNVGLPWVNDVCWEPDVSKLAVVRAVVGSMEGGLFGYRRAAPDGSAIRRLHGRG